jgi:hypothetical protein
MGAGDSKRGNVTDEHRQEAARLRALWERERERLKAAGLGSQEAFGAEFKIGNQAAVGFFLNGKTALSPKAAAGFARGLRCDVKDFSPRLAELLATQVEPAPQEQPLSALALELATLADSLSDEAKRLALLTLARAMTQPQAGPDVAASQPLSRKRLRAA